MPSSLMSCTLLQSSVSLPRYSYPLSLPKIVTISPPHTHNLWKLTPKLMKTTKICGTNSPVDPYAFLHITQNSDNSITRHRQDPTTPANSYDLSAPVWTRDIPLNPDKHTWIRLYIPRNTTQKPPHSLKLPIVFYFHGGGFVFINADHTHFHEFCIHMAAKLNILVASVNYRLAPEHRLPAAYNDASETIDLIRRSTDPWLVNHGDLSRCVIMGQSAGANIAYYSALAAAALTAKGELQPLKIGGVVLVQPYFGGVKRTESELRLLNDEKLPLAASDLMWELALPLGVDRDHEYCNPMIGDGSDLIEKFREFGWSVVVTAVDGDPEFDRNMELVNLLEKRGVEVVSLVRAGYYHGVYLMDQILREELFGIMSNILSSL